MKIAGINRESFTRRFCPAVALAAGIALMASSGLAQDALVVGPYKVLMPANVVCEGCFDYILADAKARLLYIPRLGPTGQLTVFNLDTLEPAGAIANVSAGGATVDPKSHHGFSTTKPITMWDARTLKVIKTIQVDGRPDGILLDSYNHRVWVLSHMPPYATVIDARKGTVVGTLDLGGAPEQAVSNGKGTIYVNISNKANIAVVDAKSLSVTAHYDVSSKGSGGSGLAFDAKHHILFAYYRQPSPTVVIVNADTGKIITTLPTGVGVDTAAFDSASTAAISAEAGGTMTFIKENTPTNFAVQQTLATRAGAKTLALDTKRNHLLTMTAKFGPAPANALPRPGDRPARGPMVPGSFSILMVGK